MLNPEPAGATKVTCHFEETTTFPTNVITFPSSHTNAQDEFNKGFHAKKFERVQGGNAGELGAFDELNEKSSRIT